MSSLSVLNDVVMSRCILILRFTLVNNTRCNTILQQHYGSKQNQLYPFHSGASPKHTDTIGKDELGHAPKHVCAFILGVKI